jgi:hypothetical protein
VDSKGYWELVQETPAYRLRQENGNEPKFEDMEYTVTEISLAPDFPVAKQGPAVFMTGAEFNAYISENYDEFRSFAKRGKTLGEVRKLLADKAVKAKALTASLNPKELDFPGLEADRVLSNYAKRHMLKSEINVAGMDLETPSQYMEVIYKNFLQREATRLAKLKNALSRPGKAGTGDPSMDGYLLNTLVEAKRNSLAGSLKSDEIFDWMKLNKFPGNTNEARFVMTNNAMEKLQDDQVIRQGIMLAGLPEN